MDGQSRAGSLIMEKVWNPRQKEKQRKKQGLILKIYNNSTPILNPEETRGDIQSPLFSLQKAAAHRKQAMMLPI